jgi:hypothetical protein
VSDHLRAPIEDTLPAADPHLMLAVKISTSSISTEQIGLIPSN